MNQWTQYWQNTTALNSFAEGQSALGYYGDLERLWQAQLKHLANNASLLDIGTGNGGLAVLCYQYGRILNYQWSIHAIDAADINPILNKYEDQTINAAISQIKFQGNTPAEALPYANDSFDLICSQFAIEYANLEIALPECIRVLKHNGKFVAVMHHQDSSIVADSCVGLRVLDLFMVESNVFLNIKTLLELAAALILQGKKIKSSEKFNQLNLALLQQFKQLQGHFSDEATAKWCQQYIASIVPLLYELTPQSPKVLEDYLTQLALYRLRLVDQINAKLTVERQHAIEKILSNFQVEYSWENVVINEQIFGTLLEVNKLN